MIILSIYLPVMTMYIHRINLILHKKENVGQNALSQHKMLHRTKTVQLWCFDRGLIWCNNRINIAKTERQALFPPCRRLVQSKKCRVGVEIQSCWNTVFKIQTKGLITLAICGRVQSEAEAKRVHSEFASTLRILGFTPLFAALPPLSKVKSSTK